MNEGSRRQWPGQWGLQYPCDTACLLQIPPRQGALTVGEDAARIVQRHLPFEGGLAYGIDQLLEPPGLGARCDRFETRPLWLVREATGQTRRGVPRPLGTVLSTHSTCRVAFLSSQKVCSICGLEPPCPPGSQEQVRGWALGGGAGQGPTGAGLQPDPSWPRAALRPAGATSPSSGRPLRCTPWPCAAGGPGPAPGLTPKAWAGAATAAASPPPGSPAAALVTTAASAEVSVPRLQTLLPGPPSPQDGWEHSKGLGVVRLG